MRKNYIPATSPYGQVERYIVYPSPVGDRYYFNNLGTSRDWAFSISALSKDPFPLESLELDLEQGTH